MVYIAGDVDVWISDIRSIAVIACTLEGYYEALERDMVTIDQGETTPQTVVVGPVGGSQQGGPNDGTVQTLDFPLCTVVFWTADSRRRQKGRALCLGSPSHHRDTEIAAWFMGTTVYERYVQYLQPK